MLPFRAVRPFGSSMVAAAALLTCLASPAAAQDPADPNSGAITISGGLDFTRSYMFRGIRQETEGLMIWPYLDLGITLYEGEGSLKSFGVNVGTWNSVHSGGASGTKPNGPRASNAVNAKAWYESDFYLTFGFGLPNGVSAGLTYTAYTSPNDAFATVKELAYKMTWDDSARHGKFALKPYGIVAAEMDTATGGPKPIAPGATANCVATPDLCYLDTGGQADGGLFPGVYLEVGIAPSFTAPRFSVAIPVKLGASLEDYYEDPITREDSNFGFASVAGVITYPLSVNSPKFGSWNVHGGVEFMRLGSAAQTMFGELDDDGDLKKHKFLYTVGLGFTY